jgi:hypothetical protein
VGHLLLFSFVMRRKLKQWCRTRLRYLFDRVESHSNVAPEIVYRTLAAEEFLLGRDV